MPQRAGRDPTDGDRGSPEHGPAFVRLSETRLDHHSVLHAHKQALEPPLNRSLASRRSGHTTKITVGPQRHRR